MSTFTDLCNKYNTDKGTSHPSAHRYSLVYEDLFNNIRNESLKILEIGIAMPQQPGASLRVLSEYFINSTIYGLDIIDCSNFNIPRVKTFIGDTGNSDSLDIIANNGPYNIIIDDGSHDHKHHIICFEKLFSRLLPNSLYIIEDLHAPASPGTISFFFEMNSNTKSQLGIKDLKLFCSDKLLVIYN